MRSDDSERLSLYFGDGDRLQRAIGQYMVSCISFFDGSAEGFYHGMILGMLAGLSSKYFIRSNRETGKGRFDLQLESKDRKLPGILMEFKAAPASENGRLQALAEEALKQIEDREYWKELQERGVTDIVRFGIAFSGKKVAVKTER